MKIKIIFLSFILTLQLFSCKKDDNSSIRKNSIEAQTYLKNDFKRIKLDCVKNDGFVKECKFGNYTFEISQSNQYPTISFLNSNNLFSYNFGFSFEGIGTDAFLFENNEKTKILLFEFQFEYTSLVYVFEIKKDEIKLIDKNEFSISEGSYEYNISKKKDGIYINLNQGKKVVEKKISSNFRIQNLEYSVIEKNPKEKNIWSGTYISKIEVIRDMEDYQLEFTFIIVDNKTVTLKSITNNNTETKMLVIEKSSEEEIVMSDGKNKNAYVIQKNTDKYWLSGDSVYLINPPNEKYLIEKE